MLTLTVQNSQCPQACHPDPELFSGEDPKDYPSFKLNLCTKFIINAACFTNKKEKVYYAYSCLCGKASQHILPWLTAKQDQYALV